MLLYYVLSLLLSLLSLSLSAIQPSYASPVLNSLVPTSGNAAGNKLLKVKGINTTVITGTVVCIFRDLPFSNASSVILYNATATKNTVDDPSGNQHDCYTPAVNADRTLYVDLRN